MDADYPCAVCGDLRVQSGIIGTRSRGLWGNFFGGPIVYTDTACGCACKVR